MDVLVKKIAALGVPGLVFLVAIEFTGLAGAAALTTALAAIGPGGIVGGVMTLCLLGLIAEGITDYGFDAIAKELYRKGESKESIRSKIERYPITSKLRRNLYNVVEEFA